MCSESSEVVEVSRDAGGEDSGEQGFRVCNVVGRKVVGVFQGVGGEDMEVQQGNGAENVEVNEPPPMQTQHDSSEFCDCKHP